jgi:hypothetical protein
MHYGYVLSQDKPEWLLVSDNWSVVCLVDKYSLNLYMMAVNFTFVVFILSILTIEAKA